ncbi:MAG: tRNA (N6-isopentenyl adenosine(37)-C2)-methylthiotransferase MiaB [Candidatus Xenobia bacterium]
MSAVAGRSFHITTFGCQMNEFDSEVLAAGLEALGCYPVEDHHEADIVVFNTCCVRENADLKVYGRLGELKEHRKRNPKGMVIVSGCLAQKDAKAMQDRFPQVDLVLGTHNLRRLGDAVSEFAETGRKQMLVKWGGADLELEAARRGQITANVPVSMGCDEFCTFCIVPFVRGRLKSRPIENIANEVRHLGRKGYQEIMLLGQNVNTYGFDLTPAADFADLLWALDGIEGVGRIRFTSPHPKNFSQKVLDAIAAIPSVVEHIHLPLQAGDDSVLHRMRRPYSRASYIELVERIRQTIPNVGLTTDVIVGFPGETEEQFENTLELIRQVRFDNAFMFAYSPRQGTAAARMTDQVDEDAKYARLYRLIETQNAITVEKNRQQIGRVVEVLVEGPSKKDASRLTGRTRTNKVVHFVADESLIGRLTEVRLTEAWLWGFQGELATVASVASARS